MARQQTSARAWWYDGEIDPLFGLIAYGGDLKRAGGSVEVVPKDGLRTRFYVVRRATRVQMTLDRDGYVKDQAVTFDNSLKRIAFQFENRGGGAHQATLHLEGLPAGNYRVTVNGKTL